MPIDPDAVGRTSDVFKASWSSADCCLYALAVGAGTDELAYTTENSAGIDQQVLPTMAVLYNAAGRSLITEKLGRFNPAMLVHGEQAVRLHRPIPVEGTLEAVARVVGVYDKGSAALVILEIEAASDDGEPLFTLVTTLFIREEGGFGGDRGPASTRHAPPKRPPDHSVPYTTRFEQALLYRLTGDRNPLHSDPAFAARGGFDRPILHGLCTYGFTGRALLHTLCGGEAERFRSMEGRFSAPVLPGDELTVDMWVDGTEALFQTTRGDGVMVIAGGHFVYS